MNVFERIAESVRFRLYTSNSERFITFLRSQGIEVGQDVVFYQPRTIKIDVTKPCLLTIGNDVRITAGVTILTHGADWHVLREVYGRSFGSAGRVDIRDNVFVGINAIILKNVTVHENSIIGAGSVVTKDVQARTVVAGNPAKPIMGIEDYYRKREQAQIAEAREWAIAIYERYGRLPVPDDFCEFFELFLARDPSKFGKIPVKLQTGKHLSNFLKSKPVFDSFEEFLRFCGLPKHSVHIAGR